jgi:ankyrin repeat protein
VAFHAAMRLLARHPDIAHANFFTAIVCGDLSEVARVLAERPAAASESGGPHGWPPLLYLCNARLGIEAARDNAVDIARALLDAGADPNARYILHGSQDYPYTALTGVLGRGEEEAQTHPSAEPLARLLLERGAEPYDCQMLYNVFADNCSRGELRDDIVWLLDLIYTHAVRRGRVDDWSDPEWPMLDPWGRGHGAAFLLEAADDRHLVKLTDWLVAHGARPRTVPREPARTDEDAFVAACLRLDRADVEKRLAEHPEYLRSTRAMFAAARADRADVVGLLLDLGVSPEIENADQGRARPLHEAAAADAAPVITLLVERGAEVDAREANWNATPLGFAAFGERARAIEALGRVSRDIFNLTSVGNVDRVRALLDEEPDLAKAMKKNGATPLMWLPDDEPRAVAIVDLFLAHGADPAARTSEGKTAVDMALERGLDLAAARLARSA